MSTDALVVGGSIHQRLERREELRRRGYRVTVVGSPRQGLAHLSRHSFEVCALDLTDVPRAREWRRQYTRTSATRGTELLEQALAG